MLGARICGRYWASKAKSPESVRAGCPVTATEACQKRNTRSRNRWISMYHLQIWSPLLINEAKALNFSSEGSSSSLAMFIMAWMLSPLCTSWTKKNLEPNRRMYITRPVRNISMSAQRTRKALQVRRQRTIDSMGMHWCRQLLHSRLLPELGVELARSYSLVTERYPWIFQEPGGLELLDSRLHKDTTVLNDICFATLFAGSR